MKTKIEIKSVFGKVLFSFEKEDNTLKETLEEAVKNAADLCGANLRGAGLCDAKNLPYIPLACPSEGAFVGWKKVKDRKDRLVKLEIPEDARRSSATTNKCRCDKAKVLAITSMDENESFDEVLCETHASLLYKVGEMVYPDSFDEDRWNECSNGIHFFINKQEAIDYIL